MTSFTLFAFCLAVFVAAPLATGESFGNTVNLTTQTELPSTVLTAAPWPGCNLDCGCTRQNRDTRKCEDYGCWCGLQPDNSPDDMATALCPKPASNSVGYTAISVTAERVEVEVEVEVAPFELAQIGPMPFRVCCGQNRYTRKCIRWCYPWLTEPTDGSADNMTMALGPMPWSSDNVGYTDGERCSFIPTTPRLNI